MPAKGGAWDNPERPLPTSRRGEGNSRHHVEPKVAENEDADALPVKGSKRWHFRGAGRRGIRSSPAEGGRQGSKQSRGPRGTPSSKDIDRARAEDPDEWSSDGSEHDDGQRSGASASTGAGRSWTGPSSEKSSSFEGDAEMGLDSTAGSQVALIGIYADPLEEPDDWGDDFELDDSALAQTPTVPTASGDWDTEEKPVAPSDATWRLDLLTFLGQRLEAITAGSALLAQHITSEAAKTYYSQRSLVYDQDVERAKADAAEILQWKEQLAVAKNDPFELSCSLLKQARLKRGLGDVMGALEDLDLAVEQSAGFLDRERGPEAEPCPRWAQLRLEISAERGELHLESGDTAEARRILLDAAGSVSRDSLGEYLQWKELYVHYTVAKAAFTDGDMITAAEHFAKYAGDSVRWLAAPDFHARASNPDAPSPEAAQGAELRAASCRIPRLVPVFVPELLVEALVFLTDCFITFDDYESGHSCSELALAVAHDFHLSRLEDKVAGDLRDIDELLDRRANAGSELDSEEEDWDTQIAADLNIEIVRCSENVNELQTIFVGDDAKDGSDPRAPDDMALSWRLVEAEARQFIAGLFADAESKKNVQLYPQPTKPIHSNKRRNADQLELWIKNYASRQAEAILHEHTHTRLAKQRALQSGLRPGSRAEDSAHVQIERDSKLDAAEPMQYFRTFVPYVEKFSAEWAYVHLETCWRLLRTSRTVADTNRQYLRVLLREYFGELRQFMRRVPIFDESERRERFTIFWCNLRMCDLARHLLTPDGMEARSYMDLVENTAASVPRSGNCEDLYEVDAALCAVELMQIDALAHFGVTAITPPAWAANGSGGEGRQYSDVIHEYQKLAAKAGRGWREFSARSKRGRQSMVVIEDLAPRTVYVHVLIHLYLVSVGLSPLDLSELTRRGSGSSKSPAEKAEIASVVHGELYKLYPGLADGCFAKAHTAFALAHHAERVTHEHSAAERLLYDALTLVDDYTDSSHADLPDVIVTNHITENILKRYGDVLLRNKKYRYAIAAYEAAMEAMLLRETQMRVSFSRSSEVASVSLRKNDWRRALKLLYPMRQHLHPKDGNRNEFSRFCLLMSKICADSGCFNAALEPIRAYSILLGEELFLNMSKIKFLTDIQRTREKFVGRSIGRLTEPFNSRARRLARDFQIQLNVERFQLQLDRCKILLDMGDFEAAEQGLVDVMLKQIPYGRRLEVLRLRARLKLKRGELSRCLEILRLIDDQPRYRPRAPCDSGSRGDSKKSDGPVEPQVAFESEEGPDVETTVLRAKALSLSQRFYDALDCIDDTLRRRRGLCSVREEARLLHLRGKVLYSLQSFRNHDIANITLEGLRDLDKSRGLFASIGDELQVGKVDLLRCKVSLEWLLLGVEVRRQTLADARHLNARQRVDIDQLERELMSEVALFRRLNLPLLIVDALLCLAEMRYLEGKKAGVWAPWLRMGFNLLAYLFLDGYSMRMVMVDTSSLSFLVRFKGLCDRMVRLALFDDRGVDAALHIRIFEGALRLERDIKARSNVAKPYVEPAVIKRKNRKGRTTTYSALDPDQANFMQALSDVGVDLTKDFVYGLVIDSLYTVKNISYDRLRQAVRQDYFDPFEIVGDAADKEVALGIAAVKVLNTEKSPLGALLRHVQRHSDNVTQIYEPGSTEGRKVLSSVHQMKNNVRRYRQGEITLEDVSTWNGNILRAWMRAAPGGGQRRLHIPDHIWNRLVYVLHTKRLIGYYSVESGMCVRRLPFGGFEVPPVDESWATETKEFHSAAPLEGIYTRSPSKKEYDYLFEICEGRKGRASTNGGTHSDILRSLATKVFNVPNQFFLPQKGETVSKGRPAILLVSHSLLAVPWELLFDHMAIRSLCLMDAVRDMQMWGRAETIAPSNRTEDRIKYIAFVSDSSSDAVKQNADQARRQLLAYHFVFGLGLDSPEDLAKELNLGGFRAPGPMDAVARPTGPIGSPLTARRPVQDFGCLRWRLNLRYPHLDFVRVPWLDSTTCDDLKAAVLNDHVASVYVFLFTFTDLVESSETIFGLLREVGSCVLLLTPGPKMDLIARRLIDWEVDRKWVFRAHGSERPHTLVKLLLQNVHSFARAREIPIAQFVGENLIEPVMRDIAKEGGNLGSRPRGGLRFERSNTSHLYS